MKKPLVAAYNVGAAITMPGIVVGALIAAFFHNKY